MNKSGVFFAVIVICVILLGLTIYAYYQRAIQVSNASILADKINVVQRINDSLSARIEYYEELFIFDVIEVRTEGVESKIPIGDTARGLVYVVASLKKDWDYIPNHRIVYWVGEHQFDPDTLVVKSMVNHIFYVPRSSSDTIVQGFYEIPKPKGVVQIPIKMKFEVE